MSSVGVRPARSTRFSWSSPVDDASGTFTVSLIPETLERTTLGFKQPGEPVNLEVDVIAKYVERMLVTRGLAGPASGGASEEER